MMAMMAVANFTDPFANPIVWPLLARVGLIYLVASIALYVMKRGDVKAAIRSNVGQRIIGWLVLSPLLLVGAFAGRVPGLIVTCAFIAGAIVEYTRITGLDPAFRHAMLGLAVISVLVAEFLPGAFYSLPIVYFATASMLAIRLNDPKRSFERAAVMLYGCIWLIFSLCHIILLARLGDTVDGGSRVFIFLVVFAVALADVGGYVFGNLFHKIGLLDEYIVANLLSPNKTYVGTLGYIFGAWIALALMSFALGGFISGTQWLLVGLVIGVFSFVGGLTHSYFKRAFGVKDSGSLIPGHGGVIDRIDSIARVAVVLYYFLRLAAV